MRYFLTLVVLLVSSVAMAWSDAGHKIIGSIAFRQLTPEQQKAVVEILKKHPRFDQDFKSKMPAELTDEKEQDEWCFQQMAIWPDMARGFQGDAKKYNHSTWHYINIPSYLTAEDKTVTVNFNQSLDPPEKQQENMNAIQAIRFARKALADSKTPDEDKAIYLCWLFHVVGDIHQPLHSSALVAKNLFPTGDKGGNGIKTDQRQNLHAVWDQFLGTRADFREARDKAITFVNDRDKGKIGTTAATKLDEKDWLEESHALADAVAYDPELSGNLRAHATETTAPPIHLTEAYLKTGGAVAEKRVIEAGYRLGAVLKEVSAAQK